jgi:hypothetical protein
VLVFTSVGDLEGFRPLNSRCCTDHHGQLGNAARRRVLRNRSPTRKVVVCAKKLFLLIGLSAISSVLGIQLVQSASAVRQAPSDAPVLIGAHADAHVLSVIERSCQNCHSLKTEWPLYSRIFPFSWMIDHDGQTARAYMNLSRWQTYDDGQKGLMLSEIGWVVRNRIMPPRRYTMIHPEAKLSEADRNP